MSIALPVVLHIPHASKVVPEPAREQFVIDPAEMENEITLLTDHDTDHIFTSAFPDAATCIFPISRMVVDPERFEDDAMEPMAKTGMGVIYTHGTRRQPIRRPLDPHERERLLREYYRPHHEALTQAVQSRLDNHGRCLVLDCHSFPSAALPYEHFPSRRRPEFCLGTDEFHTPEALVSQVERALMRQGYEVKRNEPYSGCLVPAECLGRDKRVQALMIEVNRLLYLKEDGSRCERGLDRVIEVLRALLPILGASLPL